VHQPLPAIPIPLRAPDRDVILDLASVLAISYDRGRYALALDYWAPLDRTLAAAHGAWAEEVGRRR
jgi:hypothetical protein